MTRQDQIIIKGLHQNNLKNISLHITKGKLIVFTGVSGSGKSSIVFDTIAAESQRQMNESYNAFVRGRLPKYEKPKVEFIENLSASIVIDQSRLGGNARSTVGTISDLYSSLRLLYSRIGVPHVGSASAFSFNDPSGMCMECSGLGNVLQLDIEDAIDYELSLNEGAIDLPAYHPGNYYWKVYTQSKLFDNDKKLKDFEEQELNILLYGAFEKGGNRIHKKVEGIHTQYARLLLNRDHSTSSDTNLKRLQSMITHKECPVCHGKRLNAEACNCKVNGYSIVELCDMEFTKLSEVLKNIKDPRASTIIDSLVTSLQRMIEIGLPYLSMNRESSSLSGGEAQRLKLVRYMGSSLTNLIYIFDEPSTGMHPRDVYRMSKLLQNLRDKGNTVLVVEHDKDIIRIADEIIDVGPLAGRHGGQILFQGNYEQLLLCNTRTAQAMREQITVKQHPRSPKKFLPIRHAKIHNLKNISLDIPLQILCVISGVAGSGKSSLIRDVFAKQYEEQVIMVDQSQISATGRSTPATYLGFLNDIRSLMANENQTEASLFSFNSKGACPECHGRGIVVTELVFMDPVTTVCEACEGKRYSTESLSFYYHQKNISEIMEMSVEEALLFFSETPKIMKYLNSLYEVGLSYISLGQPLSTLSGGELQRLKLAKNLYNKGNIYILDEPTTGLHASDVKKIMSLLEAFVERGNTVIVIEHNLDVMKQADYIIDIGPDGGTLGGEVVFMGTPQEMMDTSDTITAQYLRKA